MRVWITKYALTRGIYEEDVEVCADIDPGMVAVVGRGGVEYFHKPYWHETHEAALAHACELAAKKLATIEKQRLKLERLRFIWSTAK